MNRIYLAAMLALALVTSVFFHPIVGLIILTIGLVLPVIPAWGIALLVVLRHRASHLLRFGVAALLLPAALASCSSIEAKFSAAKAIYTTVTSATIAQNKAAALHDAIAGVEGNALIFLEAPPCNSAATATKLCKNVAIALKALRGADDGLVNAIVSAQAAGSGVGVSSAAYNAAVKAFNAYSDAKSAS